MEKAVKTNIEAASKIDANIEKLNTQMITQKQN
jgi:hypothetical protein